MNRRDFFKVVGVPIATIVFGTKIAKDQKNIIPTAKYSQSIEEIVRRHNDYEPSREYKKFIEKNANHLLGGYLEDHENVKRHPEWKYHNPDGGFGDFYNGNDFRMGYVKKDDGKIDEMYVNLTVNKGAVESFLFYSIYTIKNTKYYNAFEKATSKKEKKKKRRLIGLIR